MKHRHSAAKASDVYWWKREHIWPGLALLGLTAVAWAYTISRIDGMATMHTLWMGDNLDRVESTGGMDQLGAAGRLGDDMQAMSTKATGTAIARLADVALFLFSWLVMMVAMMLPAALPLMLLYRSMARQRMSARRASVGIVTLLSGYLGVWTVAGLPVYGYNLLAGTAGPAMAAVPGLLLVAGGVYQWTALKQGCHTRCSNPLFFLMHNWRPGQSGTFRLGLLHGVDCLGCCGGLMVALLALGMMNVTWMLTAAVIIFAEKTLPGGHRIAQPLGVVLIVVGALVLVRTLSGSPSGL